MLPSSLLRTRTLKGTIKPDYARIDGEDHQLAKTLIDLFKAHVDKRKGELQEKVADYESRGFDFRLVRGLSLILQRRCDFMPQAEVDPVVARKAVFEMTSGENFVATSEMRMRIMSEVAGQLEVTSDQLEESLYADLEDQLVLRKFNSVPPDELIRMYNLSLAQTLLFRATYMEIKVSNYWKEVLRAVKYRGLMYSAENRNGVFKIAVDGPLSLFKQTQRYGVNFAQLLPIIVQSDFWEINASIIRSSQFGKRILQMRLSSSETGKAIRSCKMGDEETREIRFDSLVEKKFFEEFSALRSGWKITREPTPLIVDNYVLIPDFSFEKYGTRVYFEIMGFWTKKYLETKIKKLQHLRNLDMLIAANIELACEKLKQLTEKVIMYKDKVPLKPVLNYLKSREETIVQRQIKCLNIEELSLEGDIIKVETLMKKYRVSKEALMRKFEGVEIPGYRLIGEMFVRNSKLNRIENKITAQAESSLAKALEIVNEEGISKPYDILSALGYTIRWKGLDPQDGIIERH